MKSPLYNLPRLGESPFAQGATTRGRPYLYLAKCLLLVALAALAYGCGGKRTETPEYPNGYTTRVLVDESVGIDNVGEGWDPSISGNGRWVVCHAAGAAFLYDRKTGGTVRVSIGQDGEPAAGDQPVISADGPYVAFLSYRLDSNGRFQNTDIYVRDLKEVRTILVSRGYNEQPANGSSFEPSISADGRYVAFESTASNLVADDTGSTSDIFVYDLKTGKMRRASVASAGTEANGPSNRAEISGSGRYVAFYSQASNLVEGYSAALGVYLHDLDTGKTIAVTAGQSIPAEQAPRLAINGDGRYVLYLGGHIPSNLVDRKDYGLYIYDRKNGKTEFLVKGADGKPPDSVTYNPSISSDGRYVAFETSARNLVAGASNGYPNVYVLDRKKGSLRLVSASSQGIQGDGSSSYPFISADGQHVVFVSAARRLVEGYPRGAIGVFIHDLSDWGDYPGIDARRFGQATPFSGPYPPPERAPFSYPYPVPLP
jgi:Tol biopolymer transport system component